MCRLTDTGHSCLTAWGKWAARDATMARLGNPRSSLGAGVSEHDYESDDAIAELVDGLIASMMDARQRMIARLVYIKRFTILQTAQQLDVSMRRGDFDSIESRGLSAKSISTDLAIVRAVVGSAVLQKKHIALCTKDSV